MKNKWAIFYIIISIIFTFYLIFTLEGNYKSEGEITQKKNRLGLCLL